MPSRVSNCPNCGGQVEFKAGSSLVSVCPYCSSAVARAGDDIGELEILGQVAPVADLGSPLSVGSPGKYRDKKFQIIGQVQLDHGAGPWNEWYAAFDDGGWGWIAEAQGKVYVTFPTTMPDLPLFSHAKVGTRFRLGKYTLTVVERKSATFKSGAGELPFAVGPGGKFNYADVQGPKGLFGTIDYGTDQRAEALFVGEELRYDELFDKSVLRDFKPGEAAVSVGMNCPNCGAGIELKAPNESMRVTCTSCTSLLDCSKGNELYLLSSLKSRGPEPLIPLSSDGSIFGTKYTIYGHLTRSVTFDGIRFMWEEYLLHAAGKGYRWLVCSDNHWTFVAPVHAGDVSASGRKATFQDETFRHFQSASAKVESLRGEFYWKVAVGERAGTMDFVNPPHVLSRELAADEVNWSRGIYLPKEDVEKAFKLSKPLPRPIGIAPNMPNPHKKSLGTVFKLAALFTVSLLLLSGALAACSDNKLVVSKDADIAKPVAPVTAKKSTAPKLVSGKTFETDPFMLDGTDNMAISVAAMVKNSWVHSSGKLVNKTTGKNYPFGATVQRYGGRLGGTSWASGSRSRTVMIGRVEPGEYVIQITPSWKSGNAPTKMRVEARSDIFIGSHAVTVFFLLWIFPLLKAMQYYGTEKRRWADSDHAP